MNIATQCIITKAPLQGFHVSHLIAVLPGGCVSVLLVLEQNSVFFLFFPPFFLLLSYIFSFFSVFTYFFFFNF